MTFRNILFPVDFSESCTALKADVEWIAKKFNSTVTLLHVFEIPPTWYGMADAWALNAEWITGMLGEAKKRLDAFALDLPANKVKRVTVEGQPAAEICLWIREYPVDLVTMAAHGHGTIEGLMMGSVTAKVLHKVHVPVWIRPSNASKTTSARIFKIVCGVDFEDEAVPMLLYAQKMAVAFGATVTLVHSVPEEEVRPNKYFDSEYFGALASLAREEIAKLQTLAGTNFTVKVTGLPISTALAETAAEDQADMLLIGRGHSQKFLGRFRTHTYDLVSQVSCPVLSFCEARADVPITRSETVSVGS